MAQLVLGVAGAVVGTMIGVGPQVGWMVGSLLGSALTPGQKTEGPRLEDLMVSTSSYGTPISYVQGHPRIAGQIIWASTKREIATTTSQGKGGGAESTSYTYEVDLFILLTDNVIVSVGRVWSNGKLVRSEGYIGHEWTRMTTYTGESTQLPDPTYEAAVGTANAPAYRGRGSVFIQGLQLGGSGQIPNLTFEVFNSVNLLTALSPATIAAGTWPYGVAVSPDGTSVYVANNSNTVSQFSRNSSGLLTALSPATIATGTDPVSIAVSPNGTTVYVANSGSSNVSQFSRASTGLLTALSPATIAAGTGPYGVAVSPDGTSVYVANNSNTVSQFSRNSSGLLTALSPATVASAAGPRVVAISPDGANVYVANYNNNTVGQFSRASSGLLTALDPPTIGSAIGPRSVAISPDGDHVYAVNFGSGTVGQFSRNTSTGLLTALDPPTVAAGSGPHDVTVSPNGTTVYVANSLAHTVSQYSRNISTGLLTALDPPTIASAAGPYGVTVSPDGANVYVANNQGNNVSQYSLYKNEALISPVVSSLCLRAGLTTGQFDVTGLSTITKPVRALAVSQVSSTRSVLDILAGAYFFEAVLSDKIYFRPRGGTAALTLAYDELGYSADGASQADPLPLRQVNELEIPAQVALTYSNVDADYQTDTQYSDRLLTGQESTSAMQVPLGFTAAEAKAIADAMLMDRAAGMLSTSVSLGMDHTRLEPGDVVLLTGEDNSSYRMRLTRRAEADGVLRFDAVLDDASVFTQAGVTTGGIASQTVVTAIPNTTLELLDIPILRDLDDRAGHYAAVKGAGATWTNAGLYESLDNTTYALNTNISGEAVIGTCTTTLGSWAGGHVFDEVNSVTVSVGSGQLAGVTRDTLLGSQSVNAALVGSELIQFLNATLVNAGSYTLSGLLRGRRGTEWAMTGHVASERFVQLTTAGMRFITLQSSELGKLRYYKGVSAGQRLSAVTAKSLTPLGVGLECFAPVDARADRTTTDTALSWKRRTRLSTRLVGPLAISAPLGETAESYEVEVYSSSAFTTLKRTLSAATATVTYTSAQQVADFAANQTTLYLRFYQLSASVGRGYVLQATL